MPTTENTSSIHICRTINPVLLEAGIKDYVTPPVRLVEADWAAMSGGFGVVVYYDGPDGAKVTRGHISEKGTDLRRRAYEVYTYTHEDVTANRAAFAFYGMSGPQRDPHTGKGHHGGVLPGDDTHRHPHAVFDLEPLEWDAQGKPHQCANPTLEHRRQTWFESNAIYEAAVKLANDPNYRYAHLIARVYLVEGTPDHYQVGVPFTQLVDDDAHDQIVSDIKALANQPTRHNCDKDSAQHKRHYGSAFRAPHTWKNGYQSRYVREWCRDEKQYREYATSVRDQALRDRETFLAAIKLERRHRPLPKAAPTDRATIRQALLQYMIATYPITKGNRKAQTNRLLCSLYKRADKDDLKYCIPLWLEHFNNQNSEPSKDHWNFKTPQDKAVRESFQQLDRVLADDPQDKPTADYETIAREYRLTPTQVAGICQILREAYTRIKIDDGRPNQVGATIITCSGLSPSLHHSAYYFEALCVQLEVCRVKGETGLVYTHQQLIDIIRLRHGVSISEDHVRRYQSRFCTRRSQADPTVTLRAGRVEVIAETFKGIPGFASKYTVVDARLLPTPAPIVEVTPVEVAPAPMVEVAPAPIVDAVPVEVTPAPIVVTTPIEVAPAPIVEVAPAPVRSPYLASEMRDAGCEHSGARSRGAKVPQSARRRRGAGRRGGGAPRGKIRPVYPTVGDLLAGIRRCGPVALHMYCSTHAFGFIHILKARLGDSIDEMSEDELAQTVLDAARRAGVYDLGASDQYQVPCDVLV